MPELEQECDCETGTN